MGACLGTQQVSIQHDTSIFDSREMPFILLFCAIVLCPHSLLLLQPAYQWLPLFPRKKYHVIRRPYLPLVWKKIIFRVILLIFTLLSQVLLLVPDKKTGKYCSDAETLLHSPSYDINEDADRMWKGSSNKKYRIIMVISVVADVLKCTRN